MDRSREKKKSYLKDLETTNAELTEENQNLKAEVARLKVSLGCLNENLVQSNNAYFKMAENQFAWKDSSLNSCGNSF